MATNKELQNWLKQFSDDAVIEVITTSYMGEWGRGKTAWEDELELQPVDLSNCYGFFESPTFQIETKYPSQEVSVIRLGRNE